MRNRSTEYFCVPQSRLHDVFLLRSAKESWVGVREKKTDRSRYSIVEADMLVGKPIGGECVGEQVMFRIEVPDTIGWKGSAFRSITAIDGWDLHFPYAPLDEDGKEFTCPAAFWEKCASDPTLLDFEEGHFRSHTESIMGTLVRAGATIYDPACSTGAFLGYLKDRHPEYDYIASDASEKMVELARTRFDNAFVADVLAPPRSVAHCDVVICRHLNHEVMTSKDAETALINMSRCCKAGGKIIAFGHTPIALDLPRMANRMGMRMIDSIGVTENPAGIFQYYILEIP